MGCGFTHLAPQGMTGIREASHGRGGKASLADERETFWKSGKML